MKPWVLAIHLFSIWQTLTVKYFLMLIDISKMEWIFTAKDLQVHAFLDSHFGDLQHRLYGSDESRRTEAER
jgi:hypothetical protein